jgi:hypothetical protein
MDLSQKAAAISDFEPAKGFWLLQFRHKTFTIVENSRKF